MNECPVCGESLGKLTGVDNDMKVTGAAPSVGDHTICVYCHSFLKITEIVEGGYIFKVPTDEEIANMPDDDRISLQRARKLTESINIREVKEKKRVLDEFKIKVQEVLPPSIEILKAMFSAQFGTEYRCLLVIQKTDAPGPGTLVVSTTFGKEPKLADVLEILAAAEKNAVAHVLRSNSEKEDNGVQSTGRDSANG